jgi:hypothetical protein
MQDFTLILVTSAVMLKEEKENKEKSGDTFAMEAEALQEIHLSSQLPSH